MTTASTPPSGTGHARTRRIITVPPRPSPANDEAARGPRPLQLLGGDDLPWIDELTDAVAGLEGQPWRIALDAIDGGTWQRAAVADHVSPRRLDAATNALRRMLAGRPQEAELARQARSLLLGPPALDDVTRTARVARVAESLAITPDRLERVLWADVPRERPIQLIRGRPTASEVAALANVALLQRALARAHAIEVVIRGDASPILRGSAARGLIATASERAVPAAATPTSERIATGERETVLEITGPLALCHGTAVYGRALGNLVPLLASLDAFTMTIRAEARGLQYELRIESPALLPASAPRGWPLVERLANDLERTGGPAGLRVWRAPPVVSDHGALVCPDLGIEVGGRTIWVEVVGFWTPEYLARKLARYRAVGAHDVVLCVDASRACDDDDPPPGACVVRFTRRVHAEVLLQLLGVA